MNSYKNVFELIDISSSQDEEEFLERSSTPLSRKYIPSYMIVLEMSHSSAEATADEEECFDISTDSLESSCKRMRLNSSLDTLETLFASKPVERPRGTTRTRRVSSHQDRTTFNDALASSAWKRCFPQRSGLVTAQSRSGMLL